MSGGLHCNCHYSTVQAGKIVLPILLLTIFCCFSAFSCLQMPLLDTSSLTDYKDMRLGHLYLCYIGNGYVWQDGDSGVPVCLPRQVAVPWCALSDRLGLQPCMSHAVAALANWKLKDPTK